MTALQGTTQAQKDALPPSVWVLAIAALIALCLVGLTALAHLVFREGTATLPGFYALVDVDAEANLPTAFSSLMAYAGALLCTAIATHRAVFGAVYWWGLAAIFFIIGFDEVASIHNVPTNTLRRVFGVHDGWLLNAWVLPAAALASAVAIAYLRFLMQCPRWLATAFVLGGLFYVTGALGLEVIGSVFEFGAGGLDYDGRTSYSLTFELIAVGEEFFEYLGLFTVLFALLVYARHIGTHLTVRF